MHDMSKETFLRPDQLKRGVEIELTQRPEWGTAFIRGRVQGKPQLWDISKSMDKRGRFIDEDELLQHWRTPNMSNTRKEIAARLGFAAKAKMAVRQSGDDDDETIGMSSTKAEIISFYDSHPDLTLAQLSRMTGRDVQDLKRMLMSKNTRPGAKAAFAGDIETKLRSLISRFGFKPDNISASSRFGVAHVEFIDQKGKATEMVSKLKGAMKQMGVPESAITARENQYPADQDGPAQHIGIVTIDFGQMKSSRPGTKTRMTRDQTEEQKAGLKIMSAADPAVGEKIATLIKEGKPQDQAIAIALDMKRRGEL